MNIGSLFTLIIILVALGILVWLAFYVVDNLYPNNPINRPIRVIIVVIAVLILVGVLLNFAGIWNGIRVSSLGEAQLSETEGLARTLMT